MLPPGSDAPPQIVQFSNTCGLDGKSVLRFIVNKAVSETACGCVIHSLDDPDAPAFWSGVIDINANAETFNVPDGQFTALPNGNYRLTCDNGMQEKTKDFVVNCTASGSTCDLVVVSLVPTGAIAGGAQGLVTVNYTTASRFGVGFSVIGPTNKAIVLTSSPGVIRDLPVGGYTYTLALQADGSCVRTGSFEITTRRLGCMDPLARNYDDQATEDGTPSLCDYTPAPRAGCPNPRADNYDPLATLAGSCSFSVDGHGFEADPEYLNDQCLLLVWNEPDQKFVGEMTYRAQHFFGIDKTLYTVPLPQASRLSRPGVFAHDGVEEPGYWYEQPVLSWLEFVVVGNDKSTYEKLYKHLTLLSTSGYPVRLGVQAEGGPVTVQPMTPVGPIEKRTAAYRGRQLHLTMPRVNESTGGNRDQRGLYCRVRVTWVAGTRWTLREVHTLVQDSFSGGLRPA